MFIGSNIFYSISYIGISVKSHIGTSLFKSSILATLLKLCLYMLVKASIQVLYDKVQHLGWGQVANTALGKHCLCSN